MTSVLPVWRGDCAVCLLENAELLKFSPCYHTCVCAKCFFALHQKNPIVENSSISCPMCRANVARVFYSSRSLDAIMSPFFSDESSLELTNLLQSNFKTMPVHDSCISARIWMSLALVVMQKESKQLPLLSDAQAILIRLLLTDKVGREIDNDVDKALLSISRSPWNLDAYFGSAAMCYHGNFGEQPLDILHAVQYLKNNVDGNLKRAINMRNEYGI